MLAGSSHHLFAGAVQPLEQPISPGMAAHQLVHGKINQSAAPEAGMRTPPGMMAHGALHPVTMPLCNHPHDAI